MKGVLVRAVMAFAILAGGASGTARADEWVKATSNHFIVYSNNSEALTRQFTEQLEAFDYTLYELYRAKNGDMPETPPFKVFLLRDQQDMRAVWPDIGDGVGGFYRHCSEGAVAYSPKSSTSRSATGTRISRERKAGYDFEILFHEYGHHFMFQNYTTVFPAWYVEGFAEYFHTTTIDGRSVAIGNADSERYGRLKAGGWLSYADILTNKPRKTTEDVLKFYAQSWLLSHWIMTSPERLKAFGVYVDRINGGADPLTTFTEQFGVAPADLEKTLRDYLAKGVPVVSFTFNDIPDPGITITKMPPSADKLLMWQSWLETCPRQAYRAKLLSDVRAEAGRYPADAWAQLVLARAEVMIGEPARAEAILNAAAGDAKNAEAHYLLGRLHYSRDDMAKARQAFRTAYRANPMLAPNLYYLSLSEPQTSPPGTTAVRAAIQASNLMPSEETYAYHAAWLLVMTGDLENAATLLAPMASQPHDAEAAARARAIIAAIRTGHAQADILKLFEEEDDE